MAWMQNLLPPVEFKLERICSQVLCFIFQQNIVIEEPYNKADIMGRKLQKWSMLKHNFMRIIRVRNFRIPRQYLKKIMGSFLPRQSCKELRTLVGDP
jgi:hypothetical protein